MTEQAIQNALSNLNSNRFSLLDCGNLYTTVYYPLTSTLDKRLNTYIP